MDGDHIDYAMNEFIGRSWRSFFDIQYIELRRVLPTAVKGQERWNEAVINWFNPILYLAFLFVTAQQASEEREIAERQMG